MAFTPGTDVAIADDETITGTGVKLDLTNAEIAADVADRVLPALPTIGQTTPPYRAERPCQQSDIDTVRKGRVSMERDIARRANVYAQKILDYLGTALATVAGASWIGYDDSAASPASGATTLQAAVDYLKAHSGGGGGDGWTKTKESRTYTNPYATYTWYASLPIPPSAGMQFYEVWFVMFCHGQSSAAIYSSVARGYVGVAKRDDGTVKFWNNDVGSTSAMWGGDRAVSPEQYYGLVAWSFDPNGGSPRMVFSETIAQSGTVTVDTEIRYRLVASTIQ